MYALARNIGEANARLLLRHFQRLPTHNPYFTFSLLYCLRVRLSETVGWRSWTFLYQLQLTRCLKSRNSSKVFHDDGSTTADGVKTASTRNTQMERSRAAAIYQNRQPSQ